jgi:transcription antitermination factor NusA-like protein
VNKAKDQMNFAELKVKPEHMGFLIGRQGTNIKKIENETGAKLYGSGPDYESILIMGELVFFIDII